MTASIVTFPYNPKGRMTKLDYINHMKAVWRRMGMIQSTPLVVIPEKVKPTTVIDANLPIPIEISPLELERRRIENCFRAALKVKVEPRRIRNMEMVEEADGLDITYIAGIMRKPKKMEIVRIVSHYFREGISDILSDSRKANHVFARHSCMYLMRKVGALTYPQIGREFGKDHTTVINAINRVELIAKADPEFREALCFIMNKIIESCNAASVTSQQYWGA